MKASTAQQNPLAHKIPANEPVDQALRILHVFREIDREFPLQYALCLLEISQNEGISLSELAQRTNLALSTISRIIGALSEYRQSGTPYQLVEAVIDPKERRKKILRLTDKGRAVISKL